MFKPIAIILCLLLVGCSAEAIPVPTVSARVVNDELIIQFSTMPDGTSSFHFSKEDTQYLREVLSNAQEK
jgi:hypothetical protein